jgi:hypothetical protein
MSLRNSRENDLADEIDLSALAYALKKSKDLAMFAS